MEEGAAGEMDVVPRTGTPPQWARVLLVAAVLLSGLVTFFAFGLDRYLSLQTLADNREWLLDQVEAHAVPVIFAFIAIYALAVAMSVPGATVLTMTGGFLFGTVGGAIYAVVGATLGAVGLFLFVRAGLGDSLKAGAGTTIDRLRRGFRENALSYLLFLRLLPAVPFWLVNLAAAMLGVPLRTFVLATAVGIIPGATVYASVGSGLGSIIGEKGAVNIGTVLTPQVVLPLIGLALLALAPTAYWVLKRRRSTRGP